MRTNILFCVTTILMATTTALPQVQQTALQTELARLERQFGGHLGVMAKDLTTGDSVTYNGDERFPTASVIKLPIMAAFFHEVDAKTLDPGQMITLTAEDKKEGSGILQYLSDGATISLLDAVKLMIVLSDNSATNLVLDHLASTHPERLKVVNDFLQSSGLTQTTLLNRLYSWDTKQLTPDGVRFGIGVTTPRDMVLLMEGLHRKTLAESTSCETMLGILESQFYNDMIPRLLPSWTCTSLEVAHKTGGVQETKADVGLILSDRANIALAVFVDKHPDHEEGGDNLATSLAAHAARAVWNAFTGDTGYTNRQIVPGHVDWNMIPGGRWGIYRSPAAPFPHKDRLEGLRKQDGTYYPPFPHYEDSSIVVFVPNGLKPLADGVNVIVHYHGHMNDNLGVLQRYGMPQAMLKEKTNAILILPQGPYRARDSFGGKVEDPGGFKRLVEDVLQTMKKEKVITTAGVAGIIVSAHSGGYHPAAFTLAVGGLSDRVSAVFLFDAFYGQQEYYKEWLLKGNGTLFGAYTEHLKNEHVAFAREIQPAAGNRLQFVSTTVDHDSVVQTFFAEWLSKQAPSWKYGN